MKQPLIVFFLLLFFDFWISAQGLLFLNPSDQSIGRSGAVGTDGWSLFSNPSGLATVSYTSAGIGYYSGFNIKELSSRAAFAVLPLPWITAGAGMVHFGFEHYSLQQFSIATGREMAPWLKMGLRFNYFLRRQTGCETEGLMTLDGGLQVMPHPRVTVGFYVVNSAQQKWHLPDWDEVQPSVVAVALQYNPSALLKMELGLTKQTDFLPEVSFGIDFLVHKQVLLRGAVASEPLRLGLGTGLNWRNVTFDMGLKHHATLGFSSSFGIILHLRSIVFDKEDGA